MTYILILHTYSYTQNIKKIIQLQLLYLREKFIYIFHVKFSTQLDFHQNIQCMEPGITEEASVFYGNNSSTSQVNKGKVLQKNKKHFYNKHEERYHYLELT